MSLSGIILSLDVFVVCLSPWRWKLREDRALGHPAHARAASVPGTKCTFSNNEVIILVYSVEFKASFPAMALAGLWLPLRVQ